MNTVTLILGKETPMTTPTFDPSTWKPTHNVPLTDGGQAVKLMYRYSGPVPLAAVQGRDGHVWSIRLDRLTPIPLTAADIGLPEHWYGAVSDQGDWIKAKFVYTSEDDARREWPARRIAHLRVVEVLP